MGDSQGNPFIGNPFMQRAKTKQPETTSADLEPQRQPKPQTSKPDALESPNEPPPTVKTSAARPATSKKSKPAAKTTSKKRSSSKRPPMTQPSQPVTAGYTGNGYKVQVLAKIPMPTNTNMPSRDYLWFAVYPIIPRVGDCIFHDGRYFRVNAVFLYENANAGWCADLEVTYYTRRQ